MGEDYLDRLYEWINTQDDTFKDGFSVDQFKQKMQDSGYAKRMHDWISSVDNTFSKDLPFDDFLKKAQQPTQQQPVKQTTQPVMQLPLKKKEGSTSPSGIGTLESSGIKLPNVRKALGQEEQQQPIMTQPVTQRPETTVEGDDTWKRRKPAFMPDYSKPFETEQPEKNYPERPAELEFLGRYIPERDKDKVTVAADAVPQPKSAVFNPSL